MSNTFHLEVVTPDRIFFSEVVEMIVLRTTDGEIGVMAGHIPMVAGVAVGNLKIKKDGEWYEAVLTEGFMEITQEQTVILADTAEWPDEIDERRAESARIRAEERLQQKLSQIEYVQSRAALSRAMTRLKVKGHD